MVKLLLGWNIIAGHESEYFDFIVQQFEPSLLAMGLQTTDVWYTTYGEWPQIVTGVVASDLESMLRVLDSERWYALKERLLQHVSDYQQKVIPANGGYQL